MSFRTPQRRTSERRTESFAAYEEIAATIQIYIDGARTGDAEPDARRVPAGRDGARQLRRQADRLDLEEFCAVIAKGGAAPDLKARIAGIEVSGTAAMARLEAENWRGTRYTDFFVLLKRDGEWRIASKVFFAHDRA